MPKILWETYIYQVGQDNMLYGPIHSMYLHSLNIESKLEYGRHQTLWCSQKFEYWGKGRKVETMHCNVSILRRLNGVTEKLDCPWLLGRRDCIIGAKMCQESLLEVGEERIQGNFFLSSKQVHNRYIYLIWLTQKQPQDVKSYSSHSAKQDSENQRTNATSAKSFLLIIITI